MKTAEEIVKETLEICHFSAENAIAALNDGLFLRDAGYTDEDTTAIECAVADLKERIELVVEAENEYEERKYR